MDITKVSASPIGFGLGAKPIESRESIQRTKSDSTTKTKKTNETHATKQTDRNEGVTRPEQKSHSNKPDFDSTAAAARNTAPKRFSGVDRVAKAANEVAPTQDFDLSVNALADPVASELNPAIVAAEFVAPIQVAPATDEAISVVVGEDGEVFTPAATDKAEINLAPMSDSKNVKVAEATVAILNPTIKSPAAIEAETEKGSETVESPVDPIQFAISQMSTEAPGKPARAVENGARVETKGFENCVVEGEEPIVCSMPIRTPKPSDFATKEEYLKWAISQAVDLVDRSVASDELVVASDEASVVKSEEPGVICEMPIREPICEMPIRENTICEMPIRTSSADARNPQIKIDAAALASDEAVAVQGPRDESSTKSTSSKGTVTTVGESAESADMISNVASTLKNDATSQGDKDDSQSGTDLLSKAIDSKDRTLETGVVDAKSTVLHKEAVTAAANVDVKHVGSTAAVNVIRERSLETREVAHVLNQVADRIEQLAAARPKNGVVVRLDPKDLGEIILTVKRTGKDISADVSANHEGVRQAIETNRASLAQNLGERGLNLTQMNVSTVNDPKSAFTDAQARQQQTAQQTQSQNNYRGSYRQDGDGALMTPDQARTFRKKATGVDLWI